MGLSIKINCGISVYREREKEGGGGGGGGGGGREREREREGGWGEIKNVLFTISLIKVNSTVYNYNTQY